MPNLSENFDDTQAESDGPQFLEVDMDQWVVAESPTIIETTGLGPCLGIIFYDPVSHQAIAGHFPDPYESMDFQAMLETAVNKMPKRKQVKIFISGCSPVYSPEHADPYTYSKMQRAFVKDQLIKNGFLEKQITTKFNNSDDTTVLRINTQTGKVDFEIHQD